MTANNSVLQITRKIALFIGEAFATLVIILSIWVFVLYLLFPKAHFPDITLCEFDSNFCFAKNLNEVQKSSQVIITADDGRFLNTSELAIMGVLSKRASNILEFGTGAGRTTWVMAQNSPPNAKILTINLLPEQAEKITIEDGDADHRENIKTDSKYTEFFFDKSDVANKITLKSIDSKLLDEDTIKEKFDLIFVDGGHTYSYVKNDTEKAFKLLAPGGIIVWDDSSTIADVLHYLNELSKTKQIFHIRGTSFSVYKDDATKPDRST